MRRGVVVVPILVLALCSPAFAGDATTFRGDSSHSGVYNGTDTTALAGVKWKFHTHGYVNSSPAVKNGVVYVGSTDGNLYAVDADSGVWKWRSRSNYPIVAGVTPTAGGLVFFGDVGGNFYALDAANGEKLWSQQLGGAIAGGVITYGANGAQKVAVATGFISPLWPVQIARAIVAILGVEEAAR